MVVGTSDDALDGFRRDSFRSSSNAVHDVYRIGSGPAVIVIHEIPGITPLVAAFARKVADRGMTAVLPELFGTRAKPITMPYALTSLVRVCVSREFNVLAKNKTSPIVNYLRELATHEHETMGGPGVGAVGMCLTGGFALAMSVDATMVAPVLSQPSLPLPVTKGRRSELGLSPGDVDVVRRRALDDLCVLGLRFSGDAKSPVERFERLTSELGDNFKGVQIDSSEANPWGYRKGAHSVLTEDYSHADGSPTRVALEEVLDFLAGRLGVASP